MRVKCVCIPFNDNLKDNINFTLNRFYNVQHVHTAMDNIQYFEILGDQKVTVTAPAFCFSRPLKKKKQAIAKRGNNVLQPF